MPRITALQELPGGRIGVTLDVPSGKSGSVTIYTDDELASVIKSAIAAEREACAKLVEAEGNCRHVDHVQGFCECQAKADAIRARNS